MKLEANITQKMMIESKVYRKGRLRIIWTVDLVIGTHTERLHFSAFYDPTYFEEGKYDYIETLGNDGSAYRTIDIMSVLRGEIESYGINPDAVNYKFVDIISEFPKFEE